GRGGRVGGRPRTGGGGPPPARRDTRHEQLHQHRRGTREVSARLRSGIQPVRRGTSRKGRPMRRVASFLLVAGLVVGGAQRAHATATSNDPHAAARDAAAWLAGQVNDKGFVPSSTDPNAPNLSVTVQGVEALAAAGVGKTTVDAILAYLGKHIDDYVIQGGEVSPGAIADLILAARAAGVDPTSFGSPPENLVTRLLSTQ